MPTLRLLRVRSLEIAGMPGDLARVLDTFANVRALRLAARGEPLPPAALDGREMHVLDLSRVGAGPDVAALAGLNGLRSLRLYRLEGFARLDGIEHHGLLAELALCGLLGVDDLEPLARLPALAALELTDMWQSGFAGRFGSRSPLPSFRAERRHRRTAQKRRGVPPPAASPDRLVWQVRLRGGVKGPQAGPKSPENFFSSGPAPQPSVARSMAIPG